MAKNKKGDKAKNKGRGNKTPKRSTSGPAGSSPGNTGDSRFTLRDAVRTSEHNASFWESSNRLRHKGISFVSGGSTGATLDIPTKEEVEDARGEEDEEEEERNPYSSRAGSEPEQANRFNPAAAAFDPVLMPSAHSAPNMIEKPKSSARTMTPHLSANKRKASPTREQQSPTPATAPSMRRPSPKVRRGPSPTPSDSSEEIVVFAGRNRSRNPQAAQQIESPSMPEAFAELGINTITGETITDSAKHDDKPAENGHGQGGHPIDVAIRGSVPTGKVSNEGAAQVRYDSAQLRNGNGKARKYGAPPPKDDGMDAETSISQLLKSHVSPHVEREAPRWEASTPRGRKSKRGRQRRNQARSTEVFDNGDKIPDDILDDYLENLKANGEIEDDGWEDEPESAPNDLAKEATQGGWGRAELEDFDQLSTSDELLEAVSHVLSRRERDSGLQYLIVWDGHTIDEARWIHHEALIERHGAHVLIAEFEQQRQTQLWNEARAAETGAEGSSSEAKPNKVVIGPSSSSEDAKEEYDPENDSEGIDESGVDDEDYDTDDLPLSDEEDLIQRRKERMTDEHIARLLQRQEELGMDGDELLLFDGIEDNLGADEDPYIDDYFQTGRTKTEGRSNRSKRKYQGQYTAAQDDSDIFEDALSGDDYGDFDVMDWNRTSLMGGKKSKIQREVAGLELSDSDLERQLVNSWAADKEKKKLKKMEREELRAEGLLNTGSGKKAKKYGTKNNKGLSIEEFEDELEDFLNSEKRQLALPPMEKKLRKLIHEMANQFGLKSKSNGSGVNRYPVLHKTSRTKRFDAATFDRLENRLSKRFGVWGDFGGGSQRGKVPKAFARKGDTTLADGQRVGAGAKEIGVENKGRAMLEKMGWSKGTALGGVDNKGILVPIDSVMKKTRAGLG